MRLYLYVAILAALLYPLLSLFFWGEDLTRALLGFWFGAFLCVGVGLCSSIVLWVIQTLSLKVSPLFRLAFIRLVGAEVVGVFSVAQIVFMIWVDSGEYVPMNFGGFLNVEIPAFVAAFASYHIVGLLVGSLAPQPAVQPKKRR